MTAQLLLFFNLLGTSATHADERNLQMEVQVLDYVCNPKRTVVQPSNEQEPIHLLDSLKRVSSCFEGRQSMAGCVFFSM